MSPELTVPASDPVAPSRFGRRAALFIVGIVWAMGMVVYFRASDFVLLRSFSSSRLPGAFLADRALGFASWLFDFDYKWHVSSRTTAVENIYSIRRSLLSYANTVGVLPSTAEGLQALVERPASLEGSKKWTQIFDRLPLDPWRRPFIYEHPGRERSHSFDLRSGSFGFYGSTGINDFTFTLHSAGPDGIPNTDDDVWPK